MSDQDQAPSARPRNKILSDREKELIAEFWHRSHDVETVQQEFKSAVKMDRHCLFNGMATVALALEHEQRVQERTAKIMKAVDAKKSKDELRGERAKYIIGVLQDADHLLEQATLWASKKTIGKGDDTACVALLEKIVTAIVRLESISTEEPLCKGKIDAFKRNGEKIVSLCHASSSAAQYRDFFILLEGTAVSADPLSLAAAGNVSALDGSLQLGDTPSRKRKRRSLKSVTEDDMIALLEEPDEEGTSALAGARSRNRKRPLSKLVNDANKSLKKRVEGLGSKLTDFLNILETYNMAKLETNEHLARPKSVSASSPLRNLATAPALAEHSELGEVAGGMLAMHESAAGGAVAGSGLLSTLGLQRSSGRGDSDDESDNEDTTAKQLQQQQLQQQQVGEGEDKLLQLRVLVSGVVEEVRRLQDSGEAGFAIDPRLPTGVVLATQDVRGRGFGLLSNTTPEAAQLLQAVFHAFFPPAHRFDSRYDSRPATLSKERLVRLSLSAPKYRAFTTDGAKHGTNFEADMDDDDEDNE